VRFSAPLQPTIITKKAILEVDNSMVFGMVVYLDLTKKRIKWNSDLSTFNSGTLLNTVWKKVLLTLYIVKRSYVAEVSENFSKPYEKITNPDNNGYGFNFIINSDIQNSVNNGNLSNTTLGSQSSNYIVVEEHLKGNLDSTT
jgi:hypothetical protein